MNDGQTEKKAFNFFLRISLCGYSNFLSICVWVCIECKWNCDLSSKMSTKGLVRFISMTKSSLIMDLWIKSNGISGKFSDAHCKDIFPKTLIFRPNRNQFDFWRNLYISRALLFSSRIGYSVICQIGFPRITTKSLQFITLPKNTPKTATLDFSELNTVKFREFDGQVLKTNRPSTSCHSIWKKFRCAQFHQFNWHTLMCRTKIVAAACCHFVHCHVSLFIVN